MKSDPAIMAAAAAVFTATAGLTGLVRGFALRRGMMDIPNERSSHGIPTPRGGGVGFVIAILAALAALWAIHRIETPLFLALAPGGALIALVGVVDDRRGLSAGVRLGFHLAACAFSLWILGGMPPPRVGNAVIEWGWAGHLIGLVGMAWLVNAFNFMDGIDGIAGVEGLCLGAGMAALAFGFTGGGAAAGLIAAAGCAGFLLWNAPPAKIFMGDVGSGFLGYIFAVLLIAGAHASPSGIWTGLILWCVFAADATFTLVRRMIRREKFTAPHRSHAYQKASRRWSHRATTLATGLINLVWLTPLAALSAAWPGWGAALLALAIAPLAGVWVWLRAGTPGD
ncbi:MAG: putative undecaprenyl-phosphate N-acetylglucosaminyl 1-phosphate transferase [Myxococcota bacterium]|nr:putative undecaprenyl-phosphate N-acetylglucosaminyl 1-phosphate transferase [Myxococcota bacterium]